MPEEPRRRIPRRARRPGAPGADPAPQERGRAVRAKDDTDRVWNDGDDSNDERLRRDRPPHWG